MFNNMGSTHPVVTSCVLYRFPKGASHRMTYASLLYTKQSLHIILPHSPCRCGVAGTPFFFPFDTLITPLEVNRVHPGLLHDPPMVANQPL